MTISVYNEFNVGDKVEVFVAEHFHCISPTELQPMYIDFNGDTLEVPGGTGWIPGTIVEYIQKGGDWLCDVYDIQYDKQFNRQEGIIVPIEYIRFGSGSVNTEWHTQG